MHSPFMKYNRYKWILILLTVTSYNLSAQTDQEKWLAAIEDIDLPIVEITTVNGEMPSYDVVTHPEGAMGNSIQTPLKCLQK